MPEIIWLLIGAVIGIALGFVGARFLASSSAKRAAQEAETVVADAKPVSYTHLDVYKRQPQRVRLLRHPAAARRRGHPPGHEPHGIARRIRGAARTRAPPHPGRHAAYDAHSGLPRRDGRPVRGAVRLRGGCRVRLRGRVPLLARGGNARVRPAGPGGRGREGRPGPCLLYTSRCV